MCLIASGQSGGPVVAEGIRFLEGSVRADGSWPIDTNLATWITTLAVNALLGGPDDPADDFPAGDRQTVRDWLLGQQYRVEHPYTHAAPGGWAWTDLAGGVPDADDTAGALLALARLGPMDPQSVNSAELGVRWLLGLQNSDGGIPTFCRGWTGLPFDRSSADLTAHALRAWVVWREWLPSELQNQLDGAARRGLQYLIRTQRTDGAWAPLWFGNQHTPEVENLTYGTSRVLRLATVPVYSRLVPEWPDRLRLGRNWLRTNQNPDGGWGGRTGTPSSIEETALAIEGLTSGAPDEPPVEEAVIRGIVWLTAQVNQARISPEPIGFYFANLWYFDELYPIIFAMAAVNQAYYRCGLPVS
jgi:squalene-hopene/tetraprenyl-beta-curcumene cyclase